MTFWLWFLVALAGWIVADALIVLGFYVVGNVHRWSRRRRFVPKNPADFNLAPDLADQRPARVIRRATAYRHLIDR